VGGGLNTLERVNVIMYRPHETEDERPDDCTLDATPSRVNQKQ
jgi:hypothetical protein